MNKLTLLPLAQLNSAQHALDGGYPELAVIHAQTACEVATAQCLDRLRQGLPALPDSQAYNLGTHNKKILKEYRRLTNDAIQEATWWTEFLAHTRRRHDVVHQGATVERADAQRSLDAARNLVNHLAELLKRMGLSEFSAVPG
jgi:hypothetical protein